MSSQQTIHNLMMQLGPVFKLHQVTEFAEDLSWHIVIDESTRMDIEFDEKGDRLILTADVAAVKMQAREKTFELLLRYNYLTTEHGGVRAALDGTPGRVVLMVEMPCCNLEISRLCCVLQNLRTVVDGWRTVLVSIASGVISSKESYAMAGMIRG